MVIKNICLGFVELFLCVLLLKIIFSMKSCDVGVWGDGVKYVLILLLNYFWYEKVL